jgi:hypothetical protein
MKALMPTTSLRPTTPVSTVRSFRIVTVTEIRQPSGK